MSERVQRLGTLLPNRYNSAPSLHGKRRSPRRFPAFEPSPGLFVAPGIGCCAVVVGTTGGTLLSLACRKLFCNSQACIDRREACGTLTKRIPVRRLQSWQATSPDHR